MFGKVSLEGEWSMASGKVWGGGRDPSPLRPRRRCQHLTGGRKMGRSYF